MISKEVSFSKKLKQLFTSAPKKNNWDGLIEAYKPWLPVTKKTPIITLKEGATPLIAVSYTHLTLPTKRIV